ncbi:uncharacterized protein JCM6883_000531 [Sporobolomyces salmoneus]|uniref:uncharacterized protein n=1 Tax=Sporobolomyces salmoneus TaxID=183962 RepID=UPI00317DC6C8
MSTYHPHDPLTAGEILQASALFRTELLNRGIQSVKSCCVALVEPPKAQVLAYLGSSLSPDDVSPEKSSTRPERKAEGHLIDVLTGTAFELQCVFPSSSSSDNTTESSKKPTLSSFKQLPIGVQPAITLEELDETEAVVCNDPEVIRLCREVGVEKDQIRADCWSIRYENRFGEGRRLQQAFVYARVRDHEHLYAHPLDFNVVVDTNTKEILKIDFASHRLGGDKLSGTGSTVPHSVEGDSLVDAGRERIAPSMDEHNFLPDLIKEERKARGQDWSVRTDLKPLEITQPQGVSFNMRGNEIAWQNWKFHIGFNHREGIVLSTIQYFDVDEKRYRPICYRASFAEMVVPYAAPEWPHPRKFAFDVGEYGLGMMANSLELGCDCLGAIHYLDAEMSNHAGQPVTLKNCVCIHEEDDGLLWKHTDFRKGGRAQAVRSRKLIVSMICTVANYEYLFRWCFKQDATMELEVRLTGILNTYVAATGEQASEFGTLVAPQVQAHHHQHLFSLRVDPMVDGLKNTIVESEVRPLEAPTGSAENWAGNGFDSVKKELKTTAEGARLADPLKGRQWTMTNSNKKHYSSGASVGYKIICKDTPPLLPHPDSLVGRRATFAKNTLWVTPYEDGQLYPAGKYPTQSPFAPEDSLEHWLKGDRSIENEDVVVWYTFGATHVPRPEDFPVMPYEDVKIAFKPVSFFRANPSLDVPASVDTKSVHALGGGAMPMSDAKENGKTCCK